MFFTKNWKTKRARENFLKEGKQQPLTKLLIPPLSAVSKNCWLRKEKKLEEHYCFRGYCLLLRHSHKQYILLSGQLILTNTVNKNTNKSFKFTI